MARGLHRRVPLGSGPRTSHAHVGRFAVTVALAILAAPIDIAGQEATLESVLARAGRYVIEFQHQLSGIVAEESYTQWTRRSVRSEERRRLRSDFLLVRPEGTDRYVEFRDVFEVDGRPVRNREERLTRLFLDPSISATRQVAAITEESARYNIGGIERTLNTPTLALFVLHPWYQTHVAFARADTTRGLSLGGETPADSPKVWIVEYEEGPGVTLVEGADGKTLPAKGRLWIEPTMGHVLATEFIIEDRDVRARIEVTYDFDPALGLFVPTEMRERYDNRRNGSIVEGTATYGRFRQFQVQFEEALQVRD
jgi:hypothetical protein